MKIVRFDGCGFGRLAALALAVAPATAHAQYYIGPSFVKLPGVAGGTRLARYKDWVRAEAFYWTKRPPLREIRGISGDISGLQFTGSRAPRKGPDMLALAVDKSSAAYKPLMAQCRSGAVIPEVRFAESAEMTRHPQEHGPRPADVPEYYEYALKGVHLTCPVVDGAPEQAIEVRFDAIEWLNAKPLPKPVAISAQPANLPKGPKSGTSRTFVVSWMSGVADARDDQCPKMNTKPSQADYYAQMSSERAAAQRAFLADKGGANTMYLPYRGPDELNVTMLPGIVPDPGFITPKVDVVRGFNLDGNDGTGAPPRGIRKHQNFTSPDGEKGIDNQLFTIQGCVEGWRRKGFLPMIGNELRRAGGLSILIDISGIDDPRNDNDVAVTILYSTDGMRRDATSKIVLPDYTYRVSDKPEYTQDFVRFHAKIVDGVITTTSVPKVYIHENSGGSGWPLMNARMRLKINSDGTLTALIGGYRDWREYLGMAFFRSSDYENTIGYQTPAMYDAVRRAADGLQDPVSGEFTGISAAYDIEGIPAFIPPGEEKQLLAGGRYPAAAKSNPSSALASSR
ncbi:MAG: hypothetical protein JF593_13255 [Novosphingobium sp.]|nr:hypothetical protein [Novosphingobium sp.]